MISLTDFPSHLRASMAGTQRDFAHRIGVSETYISLLLSGKKKPSPKVLGALGLRRETFLMPAQEGEA